MKNLEELVKQQPYLSDNDSYQKSFINAFKDIDLIYLNKKMSVSFDSKNQFLQSLMEIIIYRHFNNEEFTLEFDKRVNNENKKDIDILATKNGITFNIEVKCPSVEEKNENEIVGRQIHRYSNNKEDNSNMDMVLEEINNEINAVLKKTNSNQKSRTQKMDDNKLKDYVCKSNEKFNDTKINELNILFLCFTTNEFISYLDYMLNEDTGLFTKNPYVNKAYFNKIDYFIFSNIKSGHYTFDLTTYDPSFDIRDINKYINFIIPNSTNRQDKNPQKSNDKKLLLFESLFDLYIDYCEYRKDFKKDYPDLPQCHALTFPEYISKKFPLLHKEYKGCLKQKL